MKVVISNPIGADTSTGSGQWPHSSYHQPLLSTLREAASRAARQQQSILASFTFPIAWHDALRVFTHARQAGLGECFFWEHPVAQNTLVGIGTAATIETHGIARFTNAASAWRTLLHDAVVTYAESSAPSASSGPLLFGGFTFDPLSARTPLWSEFPDGLLILPQMLLSYHDNQVTLTVNRLVRASDDIEPCAHELETKARQLQDVVQHIPAIPPVVMPLVGIRQPEIPPVVMPLVGIRLQDAVGISQHELPPASAWMEMVASVVDMIRHGAFEKVVLARDIQLTLHDASGAFDITSTLQRLRESYPTAYVFALQRGERFFVGATPERLVQAQDGQIQTMALAGSARRGETEEEDARIGMELLQSEKNNSEHAIVVAMVREALKNHCVHVRVSPVPQLLKLKNVQHLKTPIVGELLPGQCILDILADLHPTPAVGGFPREAALAAIRSTEKMDRGWYAAPLGWIGASGHGEFAVALRSGLIDGNTARLFAGCGIVADSDPQSEFAESCLKFQVMLRALSGNRE
jgi:isochorismate synthase